MPGWRRGRHSSPKGGCADQVGHFLPPAKERCRRQASEDAQSSFIACIKQPGGKLALRETISSCRSGAHAPGQRAQQEGLAGHHPTPTENAREEGPALLPLQEAQRSRAA